MSFDFTTLAFALVAFIGGIVAVPVGGSFLFVMPLFLLLGLNGLQTLLLSRIFAFGATGSGSIYFLRNHREHYGWKQITFFLSGNLIGYVIAAKIATSINTETLTAMVPWVLLGGAVFLLRDWKVEQVKCRQLLAKLLPFFGLLIGFYTGLGGAPSVFVILLLTLAIGWTMHRAIVNTRLIEVFGNTIGAAAYLYFGAALTGYELPVLLAGAAGGLIGAKLTFRSKPAWLKKAFLLLVLITAIKTSWPFIEKLSH
ncbi:MAG: sulfite exporter TauE/SafE family protein [Patescibacteria group bacterium]